MKNLPLDKRTKELLGFQDLDPAEAMEEEEKKAEMLAEPRTLKLSGPGAGMDINIVVGGKGKKLVRKNDTSKPEKSV